MEETPKYEKAITNFEERHPETMPVPEQQSFFTTIERLAMRPDVDVEKIKQIMEMQEHVLDRNAKQAFNAAMTKAQSGIKLVIAKKKNQQTGSYYADLKDILIHTKEVYTEQGFSLMFYEGKTQKENHIRVGVDIMHEQGHTERRYADMAVQTTGIAGKAMMTLVHGEGSAFSYGRRYLTCMIFNIPTGDDDDGKAAGGIQYINLDMQTEINDLIKSTKADKTKFLKYLKAESVETILLSEYGKAKIAFTAKKAAQKQNREPGQEGCDDNCR